MCSATPSIASPRRSRRSPAVSPAGLSLEHQIRERESESESKRKKPKEGLSKQAKRAAKEEIGNTEKFALSCTKD